MAFLPFSLVVSLLFFLLLLPHTTTSTETCQTRYCETTSPGLPIGFPFHLRGDNQSESCGYPGFEIFCGGENRNETFITLPNAGDFVVNFIAYTSHELLINDPDGCLPKRFLLQGNLDLTGSPFQLSNDLTLTNLTFLNCSNKDFHSFNLVELVYCMGNGNRNFSVVAVAPELETPTVNLSGCQVIFSALIPINFNYGLSWEWQLLNNIVLQWIKPSCDYRNCEAGNSMKSKNALGLGLGISAGIISSIVLSILVYTHKMRMNREGGREAASRVESNNQLQQPSIAVAMVAINEADIERYPKTEVEDGGGLPNPNDNVCSICLCEYQPKEILRTIPDCNHYFHAHCLEGWLKINASCPLCRNLPNSSLSQSSSSL